MSTPKFRINPHLAYLPIITILIGLCASTLKANQPRDCSKSAEASYIAGMRSVTTPINADLASMRKSMGQLLDAVGCQRTHPNDPEGMCTIK